MADSRSDAGVVDCSCESSDDASLSTAASAVCQGTITSNPSGLIEKWRENFVSDMGLTFIASAAAESLSSAAWRFPIGWAWRVTPMRTSCCMR